jgi:hypothetical protein
MGGGVRPKLDIDVNNPIFLGGGGDSYSLLGMELSDPIVGEHVDKRGKENFFTHWDDSDVMTAIQMTHDGGKPESWLA